MTVRPCQVRMRPTRSYTEGSCEDVVGQPGAAAGNEEAGWGVAAARGEVSPLAPFACPLRAHSRTMVAAPCHLAGLTALERPGWELGRSPPLPPPPWPPSRPGTCNYRALATGHHRSLSRCQRDTRRYAVDGRSSTLVARCLEERPPVVQTGADQSGRPYPSIASGLQCYARVGRERVVGRGTSGWPALPGWCWSWAAWRGGREGAGVWSSLFCADHGLAHLEEWLTEGICRVII